MTSRETGKKEHTRRGVDANERDGDEVERDRSARGWAGADASDGNATEPTPEVGSVWGFCRDAIPDG